MKQNIFWQLEFFQIQTVCFDNLGLLLAALLNMLFKNSQRFSFPASITWLFFLFDVFTVMIIKSYSLHAFLNCDCRARLQTALPFFVYPIFSVIDLFAIYQGLKHVHLQTLTKVSDYYIFYLISVSSLHNICLITHYLED